jgi:hypothetical protein
MGVLFAKIIFGQIKNAIREIIAKKTPFFVIFFILAYVKIYYVVRITAFGDL